MSAQRELNGKLVSIGEFREVRNYYMPNCSIKIEVLEKDKSKPAWIEFIEGKENESYRVKTFDEDDIMYDILNGDDFYDDEQSELPLAEAGFHYLSCHRIGVNDIYAKNMLDANDFGIDGEYTLAYLLKNESEPIGRELVKDEKNVTNSLLEQVNYWLKYIIDTTLSITDIKKLTIYR